MIWSIKIFQVNLFDGLPVELMRFFSLLMWRKLTRRGARLLARHTFFCQFFFLSQKKKILKKKIFRSNNNFPLGLNINRAVKKDDWAVYKRQHFEGKKQKKNYFARKFGQTVRQWTFKIRRWSIFKEKCDYFWNGKKWTSNPG